ncbi:hypothetical protein LV457_05510 [Mycobacterium sp. MYCO198283]|nr:hypothetical protein [Mycobacterium sp. MYCO198283]MCG5431748.1 hypothetical protein [Mycobacterium sp. MYCO198283]
MPVEKRRADRDEQLKQLRRQMAAVSGKAGRGHTAPPVADELLPAPESLLPVPESLHDALGGALPRGSVAVLSGARSLPLQLVASVTAAGGHAAIVGRPEVGLLAAVEMGADLSRLALIPDPGTDPVEVAAVLMDGMDLVVLGMQGRRVPLSRAKVMATRARTKNCTLLVTDGDWEGAQVRVDARVCGYELTGAPGRGRIDRVRLAVRARGRSFGQARLGACG